MNEQQKESSKKLILEWVKDLDRLSTSRIAGIIGKDLNATKKLLEELLSEKKIKKEEETNAVYWAIK